MKPLTEEQLKQIAYEDSTDDALLTPEELRRKRNRATKRKSRENAKNEKLLEKQTKQAAASSEKELAMSITEWHEFNRSKLSEKELGQLKARQETVLDTLFWLEEIIAGTYEPPQENHVTIDEGTADLDADIHKHGTTYCFERLVQHAEQYRESASFRDNVKSYGPHVFQGMNATQVWLQMGLLVAVPSQKVCDFHKLIAPKVALPTYVVMECSVCKSLASRVNVPQHIADDYRRLDIKFKCGPCRSQQQATQNQAAGYNEAVKNPTIFDGWGPSETRTRMDERSLFCTTASSKYSSR